MSVSGYLDARIDHERQAVNRISAIACGLLLAAIPPAPADSRSGSLVSEVPCDRAILPPDILKARRQVMQSPSKVPRFPAMNHIITRSGQPGNCSSILARQRMCAPPHSSSRAWLSRLPTASRISVSSNLIRTGCSRPLIAMEPHPMACGTRRPPPS